MCLCQRQIQTGTLIIDCEQTEINVEGLLSSPCWEQFSVKTPGVTGYKSGFVCRISDIKM